MRPRSWSVAVLGVGAGEGRPIPVRGSGGVTPGNFFEIFDAKSRIWGQFGPENKLIEGVRRDLPERYSVSIPPVANDICRSAVLAPKYLPERSSHTTTPLLLSSPSGQWLCSVVSVHRRA